MAVAFAFLLSLLAWVAFFAALSLWFGSDMAWLVAKVLTLAALAWAGLVTAALAWRIMRGL